MPSVFKRLLLGRPLATSEQGDQRMTKLIALPTFSADAISSTAYATEQILIVLVAGGSSLALTSRSPRPILVIPVVVFGFLQIRRYYDRLEQAQQIPPDGGRPQLRANTVVVLVGQMSLGVIDALNYARGLHPDHLAALHVRVDEDRGKELANQWRELGIEVPLETVGAPFRDLAPVVEAHLDELEQRWPGATLTVVTSQFAGGRVVTDLIHNRALVQLRERLMLRSRVVVAAVPYRLSPPPA